MSKILKKCISLLGGDDLGRHFLILTAVHVLLMLGIGLSSVFTSVFLFKMNNSDYALTAKYTAYMFAFEMITFIICLYFYKYFSIAKTMQAGLWIYSFSYIVLLLLRNNLIDYYILVAGLVALGAGFYWFGYNLLLKNYTTSENRQKALSFNGTCCYIVSIIASPISGYVTSSFDGMTGYIIIFTITIIAYAIGARLMRELPDDGVYEPRFRKVSTYILKTKSIFLIYLSDFFRGLHIGMTYYYTPILLYSLTSDEFILGIALMLKQLSAIITWRCIRNLKTLRQRLLWTVIPYGVELLVLTVMMTTTKSGFMVYAVFLYCSFYNLTDILGSNFAQMPIFESTQLLRKNCGADREFMPFKQILLNTGRSLGIVIMLMLPIDAKYQIFALAATTAIAIFGTFICNAGAKQMALEVENE